MNDVMLTARRSCLVLLTLAVAHSAAGQAQPVDAFRLTAANAVKVDGTAVNTVPERQLEAALQSGQALTDLSVSIAVSYRQLNRAEYAVPVSVRIAPSSELIAGRGQHSRLDFIGTVKDAYNVTWQNLRDQVDLTIGPDSIAALATTPIVYETTFTLLPGRYTIKMLARDQATGRIGTSEVAFTIPNLARAQRP